MWQQHQVFQNMLLQWIPDEQNLKEDNSLFPCKSVFGVLQNNKPWPINSQPPLTLKSFINIYFLWRLILKQISQIWSKFEKKKKKIIFKYKQIFSKSVDLPELSLINQRCVWKGSQIDSFGNLKTTYVLYGEWSIYLKWEPILFPLTVEVWVF